ncbi:MAG: ATP-binding protein [Pseudomonadota bacterium]|nr:ATP-binding protein [Pseudomonadota bacterium]
MLHPKVLRCISQLGMNSDSLPTQLEAWQAILKSLSNLVSEATDRLELTENTLAVSTVEMEELYRKLKNRSESELERTNSELLLNASEHKRLLAFTDSILEASTDGILVVDHKSGKIIRNNQRLLSMWNISEELSEQKDDPKIIGYVLGQLAEPGQFFELVKGLHSSPEIVSYDALVFRDGRIFNCYSVPLTLETTIIARVWFFRDMTEAVVREKQIDEQRAQLVNASKMSSLGEMSGGIAHEINNPLAIIQGKASHLIRLIHGNKFTLENGIVQLESIFSESERIAKIVRGLVAFSRNGDKDPFASVDLSDLFKDVFSLCSERFKNYSVELVLNSFPKTLVEGRATQIAQVLSNLLNNSFDAVSSLPEKWVRIDIKSSNERVQISVTDSGYGIQPHIVDKLMQPFFTTKEIGKGTGLGLSISKGIIEDHQGSLRYDSTSSRTRFVIELPLKQDQSKLIAA